MSENTDRMVLMFGIVMLILGVVFGHTLSEMLNDCDEKGAFYNGSCKMYGTVNDFLGCMNSSVFYNYSNWNVSCAEEFMDINLDYWNQIGRCDWWNDD